MKKPARLAIVVSAILVFLSFAFAFLTRKAPVLTVVTGAGTYERAQASALFHPYSEKTGIDVRIAEYDGGIDGVRAQVAAKSYDWDVVDFELPDAVAACEAGLLEPIDASALPPGADGAPAAADFVPGAIGPCWVGSVVYSQAIVFAPRRFGSVQPRTLADFFDVAHFPGPRALHRSSAKLNLELALLADGVRPADVYATLSTNAGIGRALAKLDTLRGSIRWWTRTSEPAEMLQDGRAVFATILNGHIYDAAAHGDGLRAIWDGQLYELDAFAVPKGDPKRRIAMSFIRFATQAPQLAHVADWVPYGPARRSALPLVGKNPELGIAMRPYLPTAPENFKTAFAVDDAWWRSHKAVVDPLWQAWLAKGD
jgi:putative spermidine/putrescine transport system substrate-binding protein